MSSHEIVATVEYPTLTPEQVTPAIGRTVFELLAQKVEAQEPQMAYATQTLSPTHSITGQPPQVGVDRDSEPDSVMDR